MRGVFTPNRTPVVDQVAAIAESTNGGLAMLSWVGGICTLAGVAALVVTKGSMGLRAIAIGVCLVVLNFAIANYLSWILVPALVASGCVSLGWAYITVRQLMNKEQCSD